MEKELNIAEILRDKSKGLKLWSPIVGECKLKEISPNGIITIEDLRTAQYYFDYLGRLEGSIGETVLFPSKSMRDWSKFAWKKGDVLFSNNTLVVFNRFVNDDYTDFEAAFEGYQNETYDEGNIFFTDDFYKATDDGAKDFIKNIEGHYGDKLNLETLEIEKPQFKPKDWCLMRDFNETWKLCQFGFMEKGHVTGNALYDAVGGNTYEECIPYNDQTAHLLGTNDDWKGGEE